MTLPIGSDLEGLWVDGRPVHRWAYQLRTVNNPPPGRRGEDGVVARRPGARWRPKPTGPRVVTWSMNVHDVDDLGRKGREAVAYNVDLLKGMFYGDGQLRLEQRLRLPGGRHSVRTARGEVVEDFEVEEFGSRFVTLSFDLLMADPFWYEPTRQLVGKQGEFAVGNPGTYRHHNAVVRIYGPATEPELSNVTSGSRVTVARTIPAGGWVELDSDAFTAVDQDGVSVAGDVVRDDVWFVEMTKGVNRLDLSSGSCDLTFRPVFL